MAHWETIPFLVVSSSLAFVAVLALASNGSSTPHRVFAIFLILVSANFGLDWLSKAYPVAAVIDHPLYRASKLFNPFDAAALLYFASVYPRRRGVGASTRLASLVLLLPLTLFAFYVLADPLWFVVGSPANVVMTTYFAACYLGALALALHAYRTAEFGSTRAAMRPLVAGLLIAIVPRIGLVESDLGLREAVGQPGAFALRIAVTLTLLVAALVYVYRKFPADERRAFRPWAAVVVAFVGITVLFWFVAFWMQSRSTMVLPAYYTFLYSGRWLLFAGLVIYTLERWSFLDMDQRLLRAMRVPSTLGVAAGVFLGSFLVLRGSPSHDDAPLVVPFLLALVTSVVALAAISTFRASRFQVGGRGADMAARKLAAYRALLESELERGGSGEDAPILHEHRDRLGLTTRDHRDTLALLLAERARTPAAMLPRGYAMLRALPSGITALVAVAREESTGRLAVVKTLRPELRSNPRALEAFLQEARALARIRHENVVRVESVLATPPSLVLEHVEGGTLADHVRSNGPMPAPALRVLARDILSALAALHDAGLVHRDVKPENVLLRSDGRAVLADLGASRPLPTGETRVRLTAPGEAVGTVLYMAPEQVRDGPIDARTDLYAAGATLVFAATGRHYLEADGLPEYDVKRMILEAAPAPGSEPGALRPLVGALLQKDPARRPASAAAALDLVP